MTRSPALLPSLLLVAVMLSACGGGGGGGSAPAGAPVASVSPSALDFGLQAQGAASSAKTITLRNTGNAVLTLASSPITLSGTNAADFKQTTTCGSTLAANASCTIDVTFTASLAGSESATLSIASNAAGSPSGVSLAGTGAADNAVPVTIDAGPSSSSSPTANIIYTSVTFCTPGSTTACRTIDHIQVDTGSYGLRVFQSALAGSSPVVVPTTVNAPGSSSPLFECVQYADGYTFGSVVLVDAQIGSRKLSNLAIQLSGATNFSGSVPSGCSSANPNNENNVSAFGANGILGVGHLLEDCGDYCASGAPEGYYYQCPAGSGCTAVSVASASQIQNPVHLLAADNNGVLIDLPSVTPPGATSLSGVLLFGVGTQADNSLGGAAWYTLDPYYGTLTTVFGGTTLSSSFVDSGSNAYFFDSSLTVCPSSSVAPGFYCPTSSTAENATIQGGNGTSAPIGFTVDNAVTLFSNPANYAVVPNLAGSNGNLTGLQGTFDWGLPFFLGRPVFVLFDGKAGPSGSGITGPALAF